MSLLKQQKEFQKNISLITFISKNGYIKVTSKNQAGVCFFVKTEKKNYEFYEDLSILKKIGEDIKEAIEYLEKK